jgi:hypothetical protein
MAKRRNAITGQWAARSIEMLESLAYRTLSLSAHRALARIEIELAHHGGNDNSKLPVTFDDFVQYGVRRHSIGSSLDELETLGFIKLHSTERWPKGPNIGDRICSYWPRVQNSKVLGRSAAGGDGSRP